MFSAPPLDGEFVMYLRKSRADLEKESRGEMETLGKHERELTALASRMGCVVGSVRRELVSGESIQERHEFQRIMEEVMQRRWSGIIVHAVDRLGRGDMMEYGWILSVLQFTRTLIVTPSKVYDPANREDYQQLQFQMLFSNNELSVIKHRLKEGKENAVRDGEYIAAHAPLGYRKVTVNGKKTLEKNEWARAVEDIFEAVAADNPLSGLSMQLLARGVPGKWNNVRIKSMIRNVAYKGYVAINQMVRVIESREGMSFVKKRVRGSDPIIVKGLHEPIVSEELWEAANAAIGKETRTRDGKELRNPLAGLLRCKKCGRAMHLTGGTQAARHAYYRHYKYCECTCAPSRRGDVLAAVTEALTAISEDLEVKIASDGNGGRLQAEADDLRKIADACAKKIDRLMVLFEDEAIDIDEFRRRRQAIDATALKATTRLAKIESTPVVDPSQTVTSIKRLVALLGDEGLSARDRNTAAKKLIERIDYEKEKDGDLKLAVTLR